MNGRSTSGTTGLGTVEVSGRSRVPSPPARIRACMRSAPPDALVGEARAGDAGAVERVAPVDDEVAPHAGGHLRPVEVGELRPFGDEHDRIGAVDGCERGVRELDALHEPARGVLGDRVIGPHPRAVGLQPAGEHERRRLAHVVGVRLERQAEQGDLTPDERTEMLLELGDDAPLLELVDLDDGGQELEVVAGVAGELLEGRDILREAVMLNYGVLTDPGVASRDLERVDTPAERLPPDIGHTYPRRSVVEAAVAGRRDPLALPSDA